MYGWMINLQIIEAMLSKVLVSFPPHPCCYVRVLFWLSLLNCNLTHQVGTGDTILPPALSADSEFMQQPIPSCFLQCLNQY